MKKLLTGLIFSFSFFGLTSPVFAASTLCPTGSFGVICNAAGDPAKLIASFINFIFVLSTIVALLYLIWGGFKWLTSGGDKSAVGAAREHIIASIIGLIVIFLSYLILNIVINFFIPGFSLSNFTIPSITNSTTSGATCTGSKFACGPKCCNAGQTCQASNVTGGAIAYSCK